MGGAAGCERSCALRVGAASVVWAPLLVRVVRALPVPVLEEAVQDGRVQRRVVWPERAREEVGVGEEGHLEDLGEDGLDAVRVASVLGRDPQQPLRPDDQPRPPVLERAAAPRDQLRAKE